MRRFLHSLPEAPELAGANVIRAAPVVDPRVPQVPQFKVLGLGSLLQVQLPPSLKLVARRNVLAGVLGGTDALTARLRVARSPLNRLLGRQPVFEQTIVGTEPLVCLLGSPPARAQHLSAIDLDGSRDWLVTHPGRVHAYCGAQLRLTPRLGWRLGGPPYTHTVVSGRGWLCLASPLSVVQLQVPAGESVLVQKHHLNAYTADTNAAQAPPTVKHIDFEFSKPAVSEPVLAQPEPRPTTRWAAAWDLVRREGSKLWALTAGWLRWRANAGNSAPFVEIHGPSTVLVSASARYASTAREPATPAAKPAASPEPAQSNHARSNQS